MPGDHWSWRWSHFAATLCHLHLSDKLQPLEYHLYSPRYNLGVINLSFWSFGTHNDCSKCGQTSRPFVEAKVQARCNTEAGSCSCFLLLVNCSFEQFHVLVLGYKHRLDSNFSLGNALYRYLTSFIIIFIKLRLHQATVHPTVQCDVHHHGQPIGGGIPALRIAQFKRTVTSIGLVQSALVVCYIPFVIVNAILLLNNVLANLEVSFIASLVYPTLVFLNSSLNPFLYCWRIKEVRQAVKATIKQLYCNCLRWVPNLGDRFMKKESNCKMGFQSNEYILKGLTRDISR